MKKSYLISCIFISLLPTIFIPAIGQPLSLENSGSDFNGVYEGFIPAPEGRKSFARLHVSIHNSLAEGYPDKYSRSEGSSAKPHYSVISIETFKDRRGRNLLNTYFFSAVSYPYLREVIIEQCFDFARSGGSSVQEYDGSIKLENIKVRGRIM